MRQSTGVEGLDDQLGGGLLPGTLTVVVGATGIGKTQLGVQFAQAGLPGEGRRGILFDVSARGDSQSHLDYARRMFQWTPAVVNPRQPPELSTFFDADRAHGQYLHVFDYHGRRVTRSEMEWDEWQSWQAELNARLQTAIAFLYGNFIQGVSRLVVDGVEPVDRPQDSVQMELFQYVYHQILRKDPAWVARDLLREQYRAFAAQAERHVYPVDRIGCLLLLTSRESMLEDLIARPLDDGDALVNANTLIYMGKIRDGVKIRRAMYIAKHRGSTCSEDLLPYTIDDRGLRIAGPT